MITCLDSAFPPSPATAQAAAAAGIKGWFGYLSTAPYDGGSHFGLYHPWPLEAIEWVRVCNPAPIMFVSGYDDPVALKAMAKQLRIRICLDVEGGGLRPDGPWVQAFLDASGAGLYGNYWVHTGRRAPFYILAAYPGSGDPVGTWWSLTPPPPGPCGWQWVGTHTEFGVSVDRGDYDDWFLSPPLEEDMQPALQAFIEIIGLTGDIPPAGGGEQWLTDIINKHNPDEVGSQIGVLLQRPEVKAYLARQAWLRENLVYDPATNKATLKVTLGTPDDDSAYVTKTALKTAIGGL